MPISLTRWLFQRHKPQIRKTSGWWQDFQRRRGCHQGWQSTYWAYIERDLTEDMCMVRPGMPTAHITRVIGQGETVMMWDDEKRTWTMPTARVTTNR